MNKFLGMTLLVLCLASSGLAKVDYTLHKVENPTEDQLDAYRRIAVVVDSAVYLYNKYTHLSKHLNVYYAPGVPTAEASSNGDLRFGENRSYMNVRTAMHEMGHTMGMGTTAEYRNMFNGNVFAGPIAQAKLKELTGDPTAELHGDSQHFWPYGLNYDSELHSEEDLIIHCQIVEAMYQDMYHERVYMEEAKLVSAETRTCVGMDTDNSLKLMDCFEDATTVRVIEMGESGGSLRFEFGGRVIDVPNESTAAGVVLGTYSWNGGAHQKYSVVEASVDAAGSFYLQNQKSKLYMGVSGERIVQGEITSGAGSSFIWILIDQNPAVEEDGDDNVDEDFTVTPEYFVRKGVPGAVRNVTRFKYDAMGRSMRHGCKQSKFLKLF